MEDLILLCMDDHMLNWKGSLSFLFAYSATQIRHGASYPIFVHLARLEEFLEKSYTCVVHISKSCLCIFYFIC